VKAILLLSLLGTLWVGSGTAFGQFSSDEEAPSDDPLAAFNASLQALKDPLAEMREAVMVDPLETLRLKQAAVEIEPVEEEPTVEVLRHVSRPSSQEPDQEDGQYLGRLSANRYAPDSTGNQFSSAGSPYSPTSVNNSYGEYGSAYSPTSARNVYATDAPKIYASDGQYLGRLSANQYDPESTANPYGRYGSQYSPTSINNPYSAYGSPYSPISPNNPYSTTAPKLFGD